MSQEKSNAISLVYLLLSTLYLKQNGFVLRHKASTKILEEGEKEWSCFPKGPLLATISDPFTQYNEIHPFFL